jgi:hypothetical protein
MFCPSKNSPTSTAQANYLKLLLFCIMRNEQLIHFIISYSCGNLQLAVIPYPSNKKINKDSQTRYIFSLSIALLCEQSLPLPNKNISLKLFKVCMK